MFRMLFPKSPFGALKSPDMSRSVHVAMRRVTFTSLFGALVLAVCAGAFESYTLMVMYDSLISFDKSDSVVKVAVLTALIQLMVFSCTVIVFFLILKYAFRAISRFLPRFLMDNEMRVIADRYTINVNDDSPSSYRGYRLVIKYNLMWPSILFHGSRRLREQAAELFDNAARDLIDDKRRVEESYLQRKELDLIVEEEAAPEYLDATSGELKFFEFVDEFEREVRNRRGTGRMA